LNSFAQPAMLGAWLASPEREGRGVRRPGCHAQRADAVLAKARSSEPRHFGNPAAALNVLRGVCITIVQFDASEWNPAEKEPVPGTSGWAEALRIRMSWRGWTAGLPS
jgi:hypothetical protein